MSTSKSDPSTASKEEADDIKGYPVFQETGGDVMDSLPSTSQDIQSVDKAMELLSNMQPAAKALFLNKLGYLVQTVQPSSSSGSSTTTSQHHPVQHSVQHPVQQPSSGNGSKSKFSGYVHSDTPRLPLFSGNDPSKGEVTYSQWKYEVECLSAEQSWPDSILLHSVRRSLRGMAADVLRHLGKDASVSDVLESFEITFGSVSSPEQLVEDFYVARQAQGESVAEWGCRLEDLAKKAEQAGAVSPLAIQDILRCKFFSGLTSQSVKTSIRHHFDAGQGYRFLLRAARCVESELDLTTSKGKQTVKSSKQTAGSLHQQVSVTSSIEDKLDSLVAQIRSMDDRLKSVECGSTAPTQRTGCCYNCGDPSHYRNNCPLLKDTKRQKHKKQPGSTQQQQTGPIQQQPSLAPQPFLPIPNMTGPGPYRQATMMFQPGPASFQPGAYRPGLFQFAPGPAPGSYPQHRQPYYQQPQQYQQHQQQQQHQACQPHQPLN